MSPEAIKAELGPRIIRYREDPVQMVLSEFGAEPDPPQVDLLRAFADPQKRRIAMKAAKGPGKTTGLAWCIWNFMLCYGKRGNHPKGAATAITGDNLDDNLWPELAKWRARSPLFMKVFEWTKTRIFCRDHPETWFFSARTWPKTASTEQQANALAGLHANYLLFVLDESGGIPDAVMAAADGGLATGEWAKILQAGNPTHTSGPLYRAATVERHLWHFIEITGDPDDPNRSSRISIQWAREQIQRYGRENPWVLVNVFGKFPPSSLDALLGPEDVQAAMERSPDEDQYSFAARILGVDAARFGDDPWVIFPRQGLSAFVPVMMRNPRSQEAAGRISQAWTKWNADACFIDDTGGYGTGAVDSLLTAGFSPRPINFSSKASDPRYYNKRSEMIFLCAEWVKKGGALPNVPELVAELTTPTYWIHEGKLRVEEKAQIKVRLGRSPNYADALALTFAEPVAPGSGALDSMYSGGGRALSEWNPFESVGLCP